MWRPKPRTLPDGRPGGGPAPPVPSRSCFQRGCRSVPCRPVPFAAPAHPGARSSWSARSAAVRIEFERGVDLRHPQGRGFPGDVRMEAAGESSVGGCDRLVARSSVDAEDLVRVPGDRLRHRRVVPPQWRGCSTLYQSRRRIVVAGRPGREDLDSAGSWTWRSTESPSSTSPMRRATRASRRAQTPGSTIVPATTGRTAIEARRRSGWTGSLPDRRRRHPRSRSVRPRRSIRSSPISRRPGDRPPTRS